MIKKTLYFGNPVYLSLKNAQLMIKLPEVVRMIRYLKVSNELQK